MNRISLLSSRGIRNTFINVILLRMIIQDVQYFQSDRVSVFFAVNAEKTTKNIEEQLRKNTWNNSPDPNVALEGKCVVVCDAAVVGIKLDEMEYSDFKDVGNSDSTAAKPSVGTEGLKTDIPGSESDKIWDKISAAGQKSEGNNLFNVGRRTRNIAFSVMRNSAHAPPNVGLNEKTVVSFDYVMVNVGNAFDLQSSTFVVPISGVYSLAFQVYKLYNRNSLAINLTVNKIPILFGFANGENGNYKTVQNSGLLHLVVRDRVELRVVSGSLESGWKYSTFSGFLLFEDENF